MLRFENVNRRIPSTRQTSSNEKPKRFLPATVPVAMVGQLTTNKLLNLGSW